MTIEEINSLIAAHQRTIMNLILQKIAIKFPWLEIGVIVGNVEAYNSPRWRVSRINLRVDRGNYEVYGIRLLKGGGDGQKEEYLSLPDHPGSYGIRPE